MVWKLKNDCTKDEGNDVVKRGRHYLSCSIFDQNLVNLRELVGFLQSQMIFKNQTRLKILIPSRLIVDIIDTL